MRYLFVFLIVYYTPTPETENIVVYSYDDEPEYILKVYEGQDEQETNKNVSFDEVQQAVQEVLYKNEPFYYSFD
jgi:DNA-binding NarL/FixJ family response regulator